jgi:hypothetical protein
MQKVDRLGWVAIKKIDIKTGRFVATQGDGVICRKVIDFAG